MRVEHYDDERKKVLILMEDSAPRPLPIPDATDFAACLHYWNTQHITLEKHLLKLPRNAERQKTIVDIARAKANINKYKHLVPRSETLNAELPDASK